MNKDYPHLLSSSFCGHSSNFLNRRHRHVMNGIVTPLAEMLGHRESTVLVPLVFVVRPSTQRRYSPKLTTTFSDHFLRSTLLPRVFDDIFKYARNMHGYNTRYTAKQNFYKHRVNTNVGKQTVTFMAIDIWKDLPSYFKDLSVLAFPKKIKRYLLSEQKLN